MNAIEALQIAIDDLSDVATDDPTFADAVQTLIALRDALAGK